MPGPVGAAELLGLPRVHKPEEKNHFYLFFFFLYLKHFIFQERDKAWLFT